MILPRSFYARHTLKVARELLGKYLVFQPAQGVQMVGRLVETEAYRGPRDKACHASWRRRESCAVLWGPPGFAYVYFTYGMYSMLNCVTEGDNFPAAVLIRAVEPTGGIEQMISNRTIKLSGGKTLRVGADPKGLSRLKSSVRPDPPAAGQAFKEVASGPGKLTQALGVNYKKHNGLDLTVGRTLWVEDRDARVRPADVVVTTRIGVAYAGAWAQKKWRFYLKDSPFVSRN